MSIDDWQSHWSEEVKRAVIRESVMVHRKKGTPWAIKRLLSAVGASAELREWWQMDPPGQPHTFEIDVYATNIPAVDEDGPLLGEVATQRMADLINSVKPVRSHYTLRVGASYTGRLAQGGTLGRPVGVVTNKGTQPLETNLHGSQHWQRGATLSRPLGVITNKGAQPLETSLHGRQHWQRGAALSRPATVVAPLCIQQSGRTLTASIPTRPVAAISRPSVFATAVFRNPD